MSVGGRLAATGLLLLLAVGQAEAEGSVSDVVRDQQGAPPNIRVEARIVDRETGHEAGVSTSGQLILSRPGSSAGEAVFFDVDKKRELRSHKASQVIVVSSGAEASIALGREIPYQQWFYAYGKRHGIITSRIDWREVGSRLSVRPTAIEGGRVRLRIVPELDYAVSSGRKKKKKRETIDFTVAATEMVVDSGREIRLGGGEESEEFYSRFLAGYDRQRRVRAVDVYFRATVFHSE